MTRTGSSLHGPASVDRSVRNAALLARARRAGVQLQRGLGPKPSDVAAALHLQHAVARKLGWTPCGWKVGAASPSAQAILGLRAPYAAPLFRERLFASGDFVTSPHANARTAEPEIAFVMRAALPARAQPYAVEEVLAAVASVHPALEILSSRLPPRLARCGEWLIADAGSNDALVLGVGVSPPLAAAYAGIHARGKLNGAWVTAGIGANVLGGPDRALTWLANDLPRHGHVLRAGDVVTTGMLTGIIYARSGDLVSADFGRLGCVHARL